MKSYIGPEGATDDPSRYPLHCRIQLLHLTASSKKSTASPSFLSQTPHALAHGLSPHTAGNGFLKTHLYGFLLVSRQCEPTAAFGAVFDQRCEAASDLASFWKRSRVWTPRRWRPSSSSWARNPFRWKPWPIIPSSIASRAKVLSTSFTANARLDSRLDKRF
jgi:hypothetical protein